MLYPKYCLRRWSGWGQHKVAQPLAVTVARRADAPRRPARPLGYVPAVPRPSILDRRRTPWTNLDQPHHTGLPNPTLGHFFLWHFRHKLQRASCPCLAHFTPSSSAQNASNVWGHRGKPTLSQKGQAILRHFWVKDHSGKQFGQSLSERVSGSTEYILAYKPL